MSKTKTSFFCQHCGYESAKWLGKCPTCQAWNGFVEEVISKGNDSAAKEDWSAFHEHEKSKTILLDEVSSAEEKRMVTADNELNRVLGGGIVPGALVLVAGEPGIGKSTLFLQIADHKHPLMYIRQYGHRAVIHPKRGEDQRFLQRRLLRL
jgi:DNA repair protein RadA/Sms